MTRAQVFKELARIEIGNTNPAVTRLLTLTRTLLIIQPTNDADEIAVKVAMEQFMRGAK
jgi:hypothetical protein